VEYDKMIIVNKLRLNLEFGKYVELDYDVLDKICELMSKEDAFKSYKPYSWNNPNYWLENDKGVSEVSQYFTVGNAINFRYWWIVKNGRINQCQGLKGGMNVEGAMYMWRSLRICYDKEIFPILDAHKLIKISITDLKKIFQDDNGNVPLPLLEERLKNWQDLGKKLYEYWSGEFYNILKESKNSLYNFIQYSRQFRAFDDPLCKMAIVNAIFHQGREIIKFKENIFPGIDYQLMKQQLRIGILEPKGTAKNKLINKKLLSKEEARELRNACLKSFIYIMNKTHIRGDIIDNKWWFNRKFCKDENPVCQNIKTTIHCPFSKVCKKRIQYKRPLENTRYY
jgi:hypothetical protein